MNNAPFGNCQTAALQFANNIQANGTLFAVDTRTQMICACSANVAALTGQSAQDFLGKSWQMIFTPEQVSGMFALPTDQDRHVRQLWRGEFCKQKCLIANHVVGHVLLVEIELSKEEPVNLLFDETTRFVQKLAKTNSVNEAASCLMQTVAELTQFDRVMLYQFLPDWHGQVVDEALRPGVDGFIGLRFPSTDVPENARRLYLLNWQRAIANAYAETVEVLMAQGSPAIDFTYSEFRAVHPVHIQYLKNIGTIASFSLSLIVGGKLWGLVACHHLSTRALSLSMRQLCEQLARICSLHMANMFHLEHERQRAIRREVQAQIFGALQAHEGGKRAISTQFAQIRALFSAGGVCARLDEQDYFAGDVPDDVSLRTLKNWLEKFDRTQITAFNRVAPELEKYRPLVKFASGILYIPLLGQDFLILMRPEQLETVHWAGKPQIFSENARDALELSPRASFLRWSQEVKGIALPWEDFDIEAASGLRSRLLAHFDTLKLESLALRDPLTGLANRHSFERALQEAIRLSIRDESVSAIYMMDLDKFKPVNDTMGHAAGDDLLIQVAGRLKALVRDRDVVARLGGDEFAIIQFHLSSPEVAALTSGRILEDIHRPFQIFGQSVEIGVSIGVSFCPLHAMEGNELVQDADLALYQAKLAGRNAFRVFSNNMLSEKQQKESVKLSLVQALEQNELSLKYQTIVSAQTSKLHGFEAFARWQHPSRGELAAAEFLPLFEQYQLSLQFAEWTVRHLVHQVKQWQRQGLPVVPVSLNFSQRQFLNLDLVGLCHSLAKEYDLGLEWLRIDLDEGALLNDFSRAAEKILALADLGVLTNIDHFGQGAISLKRMLGLKIAQLKINGQHLLSEANNPLLDILISIGNVIHVPIVGTLIENEAEQSRISRKGVAFVQGYVQGALRDASQIQSLLTAEVS